MINIKYNIWSKMYDMSNAIYDTQSRIYDMGENWKKENVLAGKSWWSWVNINGNEWYKMGQNSTCFYTCGYYLQALTR